MEKANIMVVEDEGLVAMELKEELEKMGYRVSHTVDSGEEAIRNLLTAKPDLILMDIKLKGEIDGVQTAQRIFSEFQIPIIYLTAYSDEKILSRARESEPYGFLVKPFSGRTLYTTIEMALAKAEKERYVRQRWEWYEYIVKCLGEAVIVTDEEGKIRLINPIAEQLTKYTYNEVYGKNFNDVFPLYGLVAQKERFVIPFKNIAEEGKQRFYDRLQLEQKDNERLAVTIRFSPLFNEKMRVMGIIVSIEDRTIHEKSQEVINRELHTAVNIQKNLLPQELKTIYGIRSHWFFYPSRFGSGDIFNFLSLDDSHLCFYILDVMGHGFSAALFSLVLHRILTPNIEAGGILKRKSLKRNGSSEQIQILSPKEVINELNKRFYFNATENPFFSIVYGIIEGQTGKTTIARAGHTYPFWQKKDGELVQLDEGGPAIGIFPDMELTESHFRLSAGDRIILYSDGLVDVRNYEQEHFTLQRFIEFLKRHENEELAALIAKLKKEITEYMQHTESTDDITCFILERST
jgi:PAS domain S-box-containing protein